MLNTIFKALEGIPLKVEVKAEEQAVLGFQLKDGLENYRWLAYLIDFLRNLSASFEADEAEKKKRK